MKSEARRVLERNLHRIADNEAKVLKEAWENMQLDIMHEALSKPVFDPLASKDHDAAAGAIKDMRRWGMRGCWPP